MKQLPGFKLWIFAGNEAPREGFRGAPLQPDAFYVGHSEGGEVASGPHRDEWAATSDAIAMTDTSGT
jgi:hypothetical protein